MRRFALACLAAALAATIVPTGASAKGNVNYGRLTVRILGAAGMERHFTVAASASPEQLDALLGQFDLAVSNVVASSSPPPLSAHYQVIVEQPASSAAAQVPWAGKTAFFYFYPETASSHPYLRAQVGAGAQPSRDVWMIAYPGLASLLEPHLAGLAPITERLPSLPLAGHPVPVLLWLGVLVAVAFLPALLVVVWPHIRRIDWFRRGQKSRSGATEPASL